MIEPGDKVVIVCDHEHKRTGAVGEIVSIVDDFFGNKPPMVRLAFPDAEDAIFEPAMHVIKIRTTWNFE